MEQSGVNNLVYEYQQNSEFAVDQACKRSKAIKEIALQTVDILHEFGAQKRETINNECEFQEHQISDLKKRYAEQEEVNGELTRKWDQLIAKVDNLKQDINQQINKDGDASNIVIKPIKRQQEEKFIQFNAAQVKSLAKHIGGKKSKKPGPPKEDIFNNFIDIMIAAFENKFEYHAGKPRSEDYLNFEIKNVDFSRCPNQFYEQALEKIQNTREAYKTAEVKTKERDLGDKCQMLIQSFEQQIKLYQQRENQIHAKIESFKSGKSGSNRAREIEDANLTLDLIKREKNIYKQLDYQTEINSTIAFQQYLQKKRQELFNLSHQIDEIHYLSLGELPQCPLHEES